MRDQFNNQFHISTNLRNTTAICVIFTIIRLYVLKMFGILASDYNMKCADSILIQFALPFLQELLSDT